MQGINNILNFRLPFQRESIDASIQKFEKEFGLSFISDGKQFKGIFSDKWAEYLCQKTPIVPFTSINGLKLFLDSIWEEFYEENKVKISDPYTFKAFEEQGSLATFTACWFSQGKVKVFFQWLSYGNGAILVYDQEKDELFVPAYGKHLLGFLQNPGHINWKDEYLDPKYFISGGEQEFTPNLKIIVANKVMAEYMAISYLIIKSRDESYWNMLSQIMVDDKYLSDRIFKNRDAYQYQTFDELIQEWQGASGHGKLQELIEQMKKEDKIPAGNLAMQILGYDPSGPEFITKHKDIEKGNNEVIRELVRTEPTIKTEIPDVFIKSHKKKANKEDFINFILDHKITSLYHFTDKSNIPSIKKMGGLYSWNYLINKGIEIPAPGGDNLSRMLDSRYMLQDYVRVSFCKNHPMMHVAMTDGRIQNPIILEIDPTVITFEETLFSDMNATRSGHIKGGSLEDLKRVHLDICLQKNYFSVDESQKHFYQAEVMVRTFIPAKYILNL